ncbi:MAG TPA: sensor histidine kinase [Cellvibrionaceae bacterium]
MLNKLSHLLQKTIKLLLLTLLGFVLPLTVYASCNSQLLTPPMETQINTTNLSLLMLEDLARELTIEQVSALPDSAFRPVSGTLSASGRGGSLWLRLCLEREPGVTDDWLLTLLPPYLQSVNLFQFDGDDYRVKTQGFALPFYQRDVQYRGFTYRLSPPENKAALYTLRLDFSNRLNADILLLSEQSMYRLIAVEYSVFGLYIGMLMLVIFINLIFWFRLRDGIYWRYALAMLAVGFFSVIAGGYRAQFLYPEGSEHLHRVMMVSYAVCGLFLSLFIQSAFQFKKLYPFLYRGSWVFIGLYVALVLMALTGNTVLVNGLISRLNLVAIIVLFVITLHALFHHRCIRLYAMAFLPLQVAMLLMAVRALGYGSWIPMADHLPNMGALVHLVLLNLALARRAWQAENDKLVAQDALLVKARESKERLEELVLQRTYQLDMINSSLQAEVEEREQTEVQLRQALIAEQLALKTQQEFVAMVSHEFRSPLAVIDTAAHNLEYEFTAKLPEVLPRLQRIRRNTERMKTLLNNCLTNDRLATYSDGRMHIQCIDLVSFLHRVFPDGQYSDRLRVRAETDRLEIGVDPQLLSIAVTNLVDNALKYSPENELVQITLQQDDDKAIISVSDQGEGIAQSDRDKIFGKFYRGVSVQKSPGAGLGLYLARALVEQHGGSLQLMPFEADGLGSCFRIILPLG